MNRRGRRRACIAILAASCILCGCAKAPDARSENGVDFAESETDKEIAAMIENEGSDDGGGMDEESYLVSGEDGDRCVCDIGTGDNVIHIDAPVSGLDVDKISPIEVLPFPEAVHKDAAIDILFGGEENVVEGNGGDSEPVEASEGEESLDIDGIESDFSDLYLDSPDGTIHFVVGSNDNFSYNNDTLTAQYKQLDKEGSITKVGADVSDSFTVEMAEHALLETISGIMGVDVQVESCATYLNKAGEGYYELHFVPTMENMPFVSTREMDADHVVDVSGSAEIGEDGLSSIWATSCLWKKADGADSSASDCLSLGKTLEILGKYLEEGEITGADEITFSNVALSWLPTTTDWENFQLIPVWCFSVPYHEYFNTDAMLIASGKNVPTLICINALDGRIELMQ